VYFCILGGPLTAGGSNLHAVTRRETVKSRLGWLFTRH